MRNGWKMIVYKIISKSDITLVVRSTEMSAVKSCIEER